MIPRKKTCTCCGRSLWIKRDFYRTSDSICKECMKKMKRDEYNRNRKVEDGVTMRNGRLMEHKGLKVSIYWSPSMLEKMRKFFPTTKNEELSEHFGVSMRTLTRKAREMGLEKSKEFMDEVSSENLKMAILVNKVRGNAGMFKPGVRNSPATEFKKKYKL